MRVVLRQNVLDKARERVSWLFDEFPVVVVNYSGGKDSTAILQLALEVAEEKGRLPIYVYWLDQEAEWQATVDICSAWMHDDRVKPIWLQVPFRIFNATSATDHWLNAWDPEREADWIHPKDPLSYKENVYGTDRFAKLFEAVMAHHFPGERVARLAGVRAEESMARLYGITGHHVYKGETWGNATGVRDGNEHITFYPVYDWSYTDIWKFICESGAPYNRIYDLQWQYGLPIRKMRVSNLHHETAVAALFYVQEFEPETYARMTKRLAGTDAANKLGLDDYFPEELPWMFRDWFEYRDYLLEHLIPDSAWRSKMGRRFLAQQHKVDPSVHQAMVEMHVKSILVNDHEGVLPGNWEPTIERSLRGGKQRKEKVDA